VYQVVARDALRCSGSSYRGDLLSAVFHALTWSVTRGRTLLVRDRHGVVCVARCGLLFVGGVEVQPHELVARPRLDALRISDNAEARRKSSA
jgi:hypothetical protein